MGKTSARSIASWYFARRYAVLFYSLLVTIAAGPLLEAAGFARAGLDVLLGANMLAAVIPIGDRVWRQGLLVLFGLALAARLIAWLLHWPEVSTGGLGGWIIIAMVAAVSSLRFSLRSATVTSEHLYAALSAYLLAGLFFGVGYWIIGTTWTGSFAVAGTGAEGGLSQLGAIYFSFVTLATLGYGDIVPRTDAARGIAIAEAVLGQLYLAVMVARLVSSYVAKKRE
jgi:hypothetical protein